MTISTIRIFFIGLVTLAAFAHGADLSGEAGSRAAYVVDDTEGLLDKFAPIFVVEDNQENHNKIGTPATQRNSAGKMKVFVDPSRPTVYTQMESFETEREHYTNLIYRVHFEANPFSWVPLNVGAGRNVGALAIITLNSHQEPVWLTTVQSCGCYHAIIPTDYLPDEAYPADWDRTGQVVYGEELPGLLPLKANAEARVVITIRGDSHRCKNVAVEQLAAVAGVETLIPMEVAPMEVLKSLPLADGSTTSFYHTRGARKGLVKGAFKPMETLLFGLWSWDHNVGQDREYGPKEEVGRRFYTTLFFPRKKEADLWHYARYLEHNGWTP